MTNKFISEHVDIYQPPIVNNPLHKNEGVQITIGDLHGNAMKLIFMLVKHGIATNINSNDYQLLLSIYQTHSLELTKLHLNKFNQILSKVEFKKDYLVRIIGDELADRGSNDYFMLKILQKLNEEQVPVEILISNHSIEFIKACEENSNFLSEFLGHQLSNSMSNLSILLSLNIVSREEVKKIFNQHYKSNLRAISYSLSDDQQIITIFSHSGIGLETIQNLAVKLNVLYRDNSAINLALTIHEINLAFQKFVQNNAINTLYTREGLLKVAFSESVNSKEVPLELIMWNRNYNIINRPVELFGYTINYVHGHDSEDPNIDNINFYNLDNILGKTDDLNKEEYTVLYSSNEITLRPETDLLFQQLELIKIKANDLKDRGQHSAADIAENLYTSIKFKYTQLHFNQITTEAFKQECLDDIKYARPELEKHRGWKQLLANLAFAIMGMGVFYMIAGVINKAITGNFLFFKTDSALKIDQLEQLIKSKI